MGRTVSPAAFCTVPLMNVRGDAPMYAAKLAFSKPLAV